MLWLLEDGCVGKVKIKKQIRKPRILVVKTRGLSGMIPMADRGE